MKEIKIVQISDIHWRGSSRHKEYSNAFKALFEKLQGIKPDFIVCTGDIFHTKTQGLTHEVVEKMAWMFRNFDSIAPTRTILGNHDLSLKNIEKQDAVSPIFEAIGKNNRNILYKYSGNFIEPFDDRINWCVFSCVDKESWSNIRPIENKINIALYHGSITNCIVGNDFKLASGEANITDFTEYDYGLFGDIHKTQFLSEKKDKNGKFKPWAGYPGSFIQQNFGEEESKGVFVWTIRDKNDWNVDFVEIENKQPFFTIKWQGNTQSTIDYILDTRKFILPNSRIRITSDSKLSNAESRHIIETLKKEHGAEDVKLILNVKLDTSKITLEDTEITKEEMRTNSDFICALYVDYISKTRKKNNISDEQLNIAQEIIKTYIKKIEEANPEEAAKNLVWNLKKLEFDNIFRYGEGNCIDFESLNGLVGIFGPNRIGKSSITAALMYGLFNTTDRGPMKNGNIIRENEKRCKAKVNFELNGEDYYIERESSLEEKIKSSKDELKTSTSLNFYKIDSENNLKSLNSDDRDATDKNIRRTIGTAEDFLMTSFSSQGDINRFINEGSTKRKETLSKFLNLDIFKELASMAKNDLNELNAYVKKYQNINFDSEIDNFSKSIKELTTLEQHYENKIIEAEKELEIIKTNILSLEQKYDFDSLKTLERDLQEKELEILKIKKDKNDIELDLANNKKLLDEKTKEFKKYDIELLNSTIEKMQSLRTLSADLKASYTIEHNLLSEQEKSIKKLSVVPCGDSYPTCIFIKDSHDNKQLIEEQKRKVEEIDKKLKEYENVAKSFIEQKIIENYKLANSLKEEIFIIKNKIELLNQKLNLFNISKIVDEKNKLETKIQKIKRSINETDINNKELLQEQHKDLSNKIREYVSNKNSTLLQLGSINQKLEDAKKQKEEVVLLINNTAMQQTIYNAFSKTGIPTMVLESQLPAINFELQKILSGVTDFSLEIATSSTSNSLDIFITNGNSKRVIETASGMEKMISSLALRVALTNLTSVPRTNILIIDEGFGVLDEQNIPLCLQMLNALKTYYKSIYIITHIPEVKEIVDNIIEIKDYNGESFTYV